MSVVVVVVAVALGGVAHHRCFLLVVSGVTVRCLHYSSLVNVAPVVVAVVGLEPIHLSVPVLVLVATVVARTGVALVVALELVAPSLVALSFYDSLG